MRYFIIFIISIFLFNCGDESDKREDAIQKETRSINKNPIYELVVSENGSNNFGYQILQDGKMIINQQIIPAIQGNKGFSTKEKAQTAGQFTLMKIKNGIFPPTVSPHELDSLGVLH
jgi:hypothetical protein